MVAWKRDTKASKIWILLGFFGIGQLIALIYSLVAKDDKDRILGVLFILGWLGDIILYFIQKDKDQYLSSMALYLLIGNIILAIGIIAFFSIGIFNTSVNVTLASSGFSPFTVTAAICNSTQTTVAFTVGGLPLGATSAALDNMTLSSPSGFTGGSFPVTDTRFNASTITSGSSFIAVFPSTCSTSGVQFSASGKLNYNLTTSTVTTPFSAIGIVAGTSS